CGQVQTGSFLDIAVPNGLFGLSMKKISVPSILSKESFIDDSFSMCFGCDGVGRISFGDTGSPDQEETASNYQEETAFNFNALLQVSGTSCTYLDDPYYTRLSESFHSQIQDTHRPADPSIPFEYCYNMG
ncbi:hypothetical protein RJ641_010734, partial [Dillenia turbinata]